jgi:hypothetical protein
MSASGYGVKNVATGQIDVRTVSPTERAAQVNWLGFNGVVVFNGWPDEVIEDVFGKFAGGFKVVRLRIEEFN